MFCWDCVTTLCKGGPKEVHTDGEWFDKCPMCNKSPLEETLETSAAGRELGFNKSSPKKKQGVQSCSSFTWAIDPIIFEYPGKYKRVKDEYGRIYSIVEFETMLHECPIRFYDLIGKEFL